ncbi:hypothetical protein GCM10009872_57000 [Actinopolymorpha rutila]
MLSVGEMREERAVRLRAGTADAAVVLVAMGDLLVHAGVRGWVGTPPHAAHIRNLPIDCFSPGTAPRGQNYPPRRITTPHYLQSRKYCEYAGIPRVSPAGSRPNEVGTRRDARELTVTTGCADRPC